MKISSLTCVFFTFVILFSGIRQDNGYIHLGYASEQGKPFPEIKFYLPGSIDTAYDRRVSKIEISEKEFEEIRKSIEKKKAIIKDTLLLESFQYTIFKNGETTIILTPYLSRVRKIFEDIVSQIENKDNRELLSSTFNYIINRLERETKLK